MAAGHPELRLVDFVPFAGRARRVLEGQDLLSPRYPLGYPALLGLLTLATGRVLLAGKVLAVLAGVGAVAVTGRWLSPAAGLWLLVQAPVLTWAATEGTDMPAVALSLLALALAWPGEGEGEGMDPRPLLAGLLAGAAAMMRYPAAIVAPLVLLGVVFCGPRLDGARRRRALGLALLGMALATAPHTAAALLGAGPWLPDASENAAIGGGFGAIGGGFGVGGDPAAPGGARWLQAVGRAGAEALSGWPARLGAVGLLLGLLRRDRRAGALLLWGLSHLAVLGFFFSNPRLCLPSTVAATLGAAFLPRPLLPPLAALALWGAWPQARLVEPGTAPREAIVAAASSLPGPVATTSPWFHLRRDDGWIESPVLVMDAVPSGATPGGLTPPALLGWARARGIRYVAVDTGRVARTWPGLKPLLQGEVDGLREVARASGWRLLEVQP